MPKYNKRKIISKIQVSLALHDQYLQKRIHYPLHQAYACQSKTPSGKWFVYISQGFFQSRRINKSYKEIIFNLFGDGRKATLRILITEWAELRYETIKGLSIHCRQEMELLEDFDRTCRSCLSSDPMQTLCTLADEHIRNMYTKYTALKVSEGFSIEERG